MDVVINGIRYIQEPPKVDITNGQQILELQTEFVDAYEITNITLREFLHRLLQLLWYERESFDGKRPFGDSGWEFRLYKPLAQAGLIDLGRLDEDGEPYGWTDEQLENAHEYVSKLITLIFYGNET